MAVMISENDLSTTAYTSIALLIGVTYTAMLLWLKRAEDGQCLDHEGLLKYNVLFS